MFAAVISLSHSLKGTRVHLLTSSFYFTSFGAQFLARLQSSFSHFIFISLVVIDSYVAEMLDQIVTVVTFSVLNFFLSFRVIFQSASAMIGELLVIALVASAVQSACPYPNGTDTAINMYSCGTSGTYFSCATDRLTILPQ